MYRKMRSFDQSDKSKKTVDSMIVNKKDEKKAKGKENKPVKSKKQRVVLWKADFIKILKFRIVLRRKC